jgi:hypothetical protein
MKAAEALMGVRMASMPRQAQLQHYGVQKQKPLQFCTV